MARHMGDTIPTNELFPLGVREPEASYVDAVLKILRDEKVDRFCDYLQKLPAKFQKGGANEPVKWGWYISTARNYASSDSSQEPTQESCRHGRPYNVCCNTPEQHARMTDSIDTLAPARREGAA